MFYSNQLDFSFLICGMILMRKILIKINYQYHKYKTLNTEELYKLPSESFEKFCFSSRMIDLIPFDKVSLSLLR